MDTQRFAPHKLIRPWILLVVGLVVLVAGLQGTAVAQTATPATFHPVFVLRDADGNAVVESGKPVSTMQTCGSCHDTAFIASHSFHADVGLSEFTAPGEVENGRSWDTSPGLFGGWNPILYRYLSPVGDERVDLTTAEWLMLFGARHVGGGPAVYSRDGELLTTLPASATSPETTILNPETGQLEPWNWQESGTVEMDCFLCHLPQPNNEARIAALQAGEFQWANTAVLSGTGIVEQVNGVWQWNSAVFDEQGQLLPEYITVQDPTNANCGQCHGEVHADNRTPLTTDVCTTDDWRTFTTGQIVSPQKLANSGLNLADKETLFRSWDIHAERVVDCTNCHYALNNPVYFEESAATRPDHLVFDPRRLDFGEYLYRPLHQFAKGQSPQGTVAQEFDDTLRRCDSCHNSQETHEWLPYADRHMSALSCETCHIPKLYAPAAQSVDWTVLNLDSTPQTTCRGIEGGTDGVNTLLTGYTPVLLPAENGDGTTSLAPHNLVSAWYWAYGSPERPVPLADLQAAWLDGGGYRAEVVAQFDENGDGTLSDAELVINSAEKEAIIAQNLVGLGLENPHIAGEIRPYSINHNVTNGEWATKECQNCHGEESLVTQPMLLANNTPGGVQPTWVADGIPFNGHLTADDNGALYYQTDTTLSNLYILGHNNISWVDAFGMVALLGTMLGVVVHGGLRVVAMRRQPPPEPKLREVYLYGFYERLWHWLQTAAIMLLLFTGLVIHKPDLFGIFSFRYVVQVHNVLAAILVINAVLSIFYHLASGEIKQFLPRPRGFFDQAVVQAMFYLRGIFRGEPHPFEKTAERKMNPLQQMTYLGILNVLLPLQMITGALMWGAQRWPDVANRLGGLPFLGPFHSLIAWLFAAFIVMHVYLTTTGHTPLAGIKAMVVGWDEVEVHGEETAVSGQPQALSEQLSVISEQ